MGGIKDLIGEKFELCDENLRVTSTNLEMLC